MTFGGRATSGPRKLGARKTGTSDSSFPGDLADRVVAGEEKLLPPNGGASSCLQRSKQPRNFWPGVSHRDIRADPMAILSRAEMFAFPENQLERSLSEPDATPSPNADPVQKPRARALRRRVDLRAYPGRNRLERAVSYVIATVPRSDTLGKSGLEAIAQSLIDEAELLE